MVKSGLRFILKFTEPLQRYVPANLLGQFSLYGKIFLHWAAATLKGSVNFKATFHYHFKPKMSILRLEILVHL